MHAFRLGAAVLCAVTLAPAPAAAQAPEAAAGKDSTPTLEVRAFVKTFGVGIHLRHGLVEGTEALQRLLDEARIQYPDLQLPEVEPLPLYGAISADTARAWGRLLLKNRLEFSAAWQFDATLATDPSLVRTSGLGGAMPITGSQTASRRLVDFNHAISDRGRVVLQHNLDQLAVKLTLPKGEVVVGRQVLSWGTGRLWNPTDLLSPFAPTDIDREVRHGVDAVRFSLPFSKTSLLDVLYLPQKDGWAQGAVARAQANARGFDVSLSAAKYVSDAVFGADTAGDIGPLAVHAEVAYTRSLPNIDGAGGVELEERFVRGVVGVEWRPTGRWVLGSEYYFNGFGATDAAEYADKLRSDRVTRGEISGAGRHYLGMSSVWKSTELLSLQMLLLCNLADPSALIMPVLEHWARQNVIVRAGGYLPIGPSPDATVFQSLSVSDVVDGSPAFTSAVSSLGLRSEYGASPWGVFAQVGFYF
jgi:hypothetical protein